MSFVARNQTPVKNTCCLFVGLQNRKVAPLSHLRVYNQRCVSTLQPAFFNFPSPFLNKITAINQLWVGGMNDEANISANQAFICLASEEMCTVRRANNYFYSTFGRSRSLSGWLFIWDLIFTTYQMIFHLVVLVSCSYWLYCNFDNFLRNST